MKKILAFSTLIAAAPLQAADTPANPSQVDVIDAIECRLDAPSYNGFAFGLNGEAQIAKHRHWVKIASKNPFLNEYDLPEAITVAGHYTTRRVAFSSTGVIAIIDVADPAEIAKAQGIENQADPSALITSLAADNNVKPEQIQSQIKFHKFLGEKLVSDTVELPTGENIFGSHTRILRNISNATTHPGRTFYGCSYQIKLIGKDGKPL